MNTNSFMTGKIGGSLIVNEDINKFFSAIKDIDWTDNNIYKPAKFCEVKPTFTINSNHSYSQGFQTKATTFDQYLIEDNSNHLNDFKAYKSDIDDRMGKVIEKISTQKNDFLQLLGVDGLDETSDKSKILEAIKTNMSRIINNTKLKDKLGNLVALMENQNNQINMNMNINNVNNMQNMNMGMNNMGNVPNMNMGFGGNQGNFMNQGYNNMQFNPNMGMPNNMNQQQWMNYNNFNNMNNFNQNQFR
jgi:hypothetical protein